jgi:hypothetical protein
MTILKSLPKLALAALFAVSTATAVVATEAANPAQSGTASGPLAATSEPAAAQGYAFYRPGWYAWHNRWWAHRRWHAAYYGPGGFYHPGFYIYF